MFSFHFKDYRLSCVIHCSSAPPYFGIAAVECDFVFSRFIHQALLEDYILAITSLFFPKCKRVFLRHQYIMWQSVSCGTYSTPMVFSGQFSFLFFWSRPRFGILESQLPAKKSNCHSNLNCTTCSWEVEETRWNEGNPLDVSHCLFLDFTMTFGTRLIFATPRIYVVTSFLRKLMKYHRRIQLRLNRIRPLKPSLARRIYDLPKVYVLDTPPRLTVNSLIPSTCVHTACLFFSSCIETCMCR